MKTLLKSLLLFFGMIAFSNTAFAQKTVQTVIVKTVIHCDHCKACETCGDKFNKTLLREKGIQMVELNEKEMTIKVVFNSKKTDLTKIKTAITKLGYDADELKADPVAYEGLDNCCKA
jgi:mercuric ion binding protein